MNGHELIDEISKVFDDAAQEIMKARESAKRDRRAFVLVTGIAAIQAVTIGVLLWRLMSR